MSTYTAKVQVGSKTYNARTKADSLEIAKHKFATVAITNNPGQDVRVSDVRAELVGNDALSFLKKTFGFK